MTAKRKPLDPYTLRWAAMRLEAEAEKNSAMGDHDYASGYGDAAHDLLADARAAEQQARARKPAKRTKR